MKNVLTAAVVASVMMMASGAAMADLDLAKKNGCLACHSVDKKMVGPAWKDVAAKGAKVDELIHSIKNGSKGKWGSVPMPPQSKMSDADIKTMATFIHGLK